MFVLADLQTPIIAAPMAGGPSTPELVIATAAAGGVGFLAAGYLTPDALAAQIDTVAAAGVAFGVNIFVPGSDIGDRPALEEYRTALLPLASRFDVQPGDIVDSDDDAYAEKLRLVIDRRVPLVSFTFGLPGVGDVARCRDTGIIVVATSADVDDAVRAEALGVDALCVQGTEAGGHRATLDVSSAPNDLGVLELLVAVRERVSLPLIAAGGIADAEMVAAALGAGATAVQIGTALLGADEAGTKPTHLAALRGGRFADTVVTRAFSGRPARALRNGFVDEFDAIAPAEYPQVHHITTPIRAAAGKADDADHLNLWAGTAFASVPRGSTADIIAGLWSGSGQ